MFLPQPIYVDAHDNHIDRCKCWTSRERFLLLLNCWLAGSRRGSVGILCFLCICVVAMCILFVYLFYIFSSILERETIVNVQLREFIGLRIELS